MEGFVGLGQASSVHGSWRPSRLCRRRVYQVRACTGGLSSALAGGVVFRKTGLDPQCLHGEDWASLVDQVAKRCPANVDRAVIQNYYLPIYLWIEALLRETKETRHGRALMVGLSCPQGGGKTTMTRILEEIFKLRKKNCVIASTDDFYLTRAQQQDVADSFPGNRLLELRGNPGSMDIPLMKSTMKTLMSLENGATCVVPRYDKSAFGGKGDRLPPSKWYTTRGPVDVVLLEGWCLGFQPFDSDVDLVDPDLAPVNEFLRDFEEVYSMLDGLIVIQVDDYRVVYQWREEAEQRMRASGKAGMSQEELKDFVDRFLPSYQQYLPKLYSSKIVPSGRELRLKISPERIPLV